MLLDLRLPKVNPLMTRALIECVYASYGAPLAAGAKLLDISIDLGAAFVQDCPPISYYRLVLREPAWLRHLAVQPGDDIGLVELIARFSSDQDEPQDGPVSRPLRIATASIMHHAGMFSGGGF